MQVLLAITAQKCSFLRFLAITAQKCNIFLLNTYLRNAHTAFGANPVEKIFEKKNSTLNEDKWPHFVKFNYLRETIEMLEFKVPSHLDSSFADSFNSGVKPIPISEQDITKLSGIMKMAPFKNIH